MRRGKNNVVENGMHCCKKILLYRRK